MENYATTPCYITYHDENDDDDDDDDEWRKKKVSGLLGFSARRVEMKLCESYMYVYVYV